MRFEWVGKVDELRALERLPCGPFPTVARRCWSSPDQYGQDDHCDDHCDYDDCDDDHCDDDDCDYDDDVGYDPDQGCRQVQVV